MKEAAKHGGIIDHRFLFILILLAGTFTMSLSQSSLSTAYPALMAHFGVNASTIQWLTTGFMLVMCILMPVSPWLLNNIHFKILFLSVLALFAVGTIVIILAPNFPVMMVGRVLEAAAVGILFPSFQAVLMIISEKDLRSTIMGVAGLVMGSALACGPIISGIILQTINWRGLFLFFLIVIACVFLLALVFIKNVVPLHRSQLDFLSVIYSLGLIGILYVINEIGKSGTNAGTDPAILAVSLIALILFTLRQLKLKTPLLQLRVFSVLRFDCAIFLTAMSYVALIVTTIIFPLYFQGMIGLPPLASGLSLVPAAALLSILNPVTGKLADKFGFKTTMLIGMISIVAGWFALAVIPGKMNLAVMILISMIIEGGNAFVMMPAVTMGANALPSQLIADSTAVITTMRQIFGSTGVAVAMLILVNVSAEQFKQGQTIVTASLTGYHAVFITFLIIEVIGLILSLFLKNPSKEGH
ncbi:MFS transporter [Sporolactobacillus vineae]|uniref:MFS transporter n=1 Tax=Sporolactobacillus vineae TaxID=444463 RepID=UPI000288B70D|nr:MFS transporter [Sporolactobacillus vineae]